MRCKATQDFALISGITLAVSESRLPLHIFGNLWPVFIVVRHQNRMRLYVDGILDSSLVTEGSTKTNDLPLFVGGAPYAENVCDMPMLLDEFRMFSYVGVIVRF